MIDNAAPDTAPAGKLQSASDADVDFAPSNYLQTGDNLTGVAASSSGTLYVIQWGAREAQGEVA